MAKKKAVEKKAVEVVLVNPHNFPVTVEYDGKQVVLSPKQRAKFQDESKLKQPNIRLFKVNK